MATVGACKSYFLKHFTTSFAVFGFGVGLEFFTNIYNIMILYAKTYKVVFKAVLKFTSIYPFFCKLSQQ